MKFLLVSGATLFLIVFSGKAQTAKEWKLDLTQYGLVKPSCASYMGRVEFLDDDHLVISAPVTDTCDKSNWGKPIDTKITEIDLQGHEKVSIRRTDVVKIAAGPVGYVTVCTGDRVDLLSRDLQTVWSIPISEGISNRGCLFGGGRSPSRSAIIIAGPAKSQFRLFKGSSNDPIAEIATSKGESVRAISDDGFLVCAKEKKQCEVVGSHGFAQRFPMPVLGGASGYYIVGLVASDRLLVASFDGKHLYAETPTGEKIPMGDIAKIKPPFIDSSETEMSAAEPRRILYQVDGCLLGDFDDCYGVVFRRFAVFDSKTSRMIFRHNYAPGAVLKISPNGHLVIEQNGAEIHIFRLD